MRYNLDSFIILDKLILFISLKYHIIFYQFIISATTVFYFCQDFKKYIYMITIIIALKINLLLFNVWLV